MRPAFQMWEMPWIALVCFAIVLIAWTANIRLPGGIPGGLAAVIVGAIIGWLAAMLGWGDYMKSGEVAKSLEHFGLHVPLFSTDVFTGLGNVAPLLATAIPLGIYNFTEAMNNVESASAAGDNYNLRKILIADGLGAIVASMLGSPFPPAVYIGHPGWKSVGGRIGYSLATGIAIALVCFLGLTALLLKVIPLVAILPILLYIGLVIGAQAFQASPASHAPAVVLAIIPNVAEWAKINIDGALGARGRTRRRSAWTSWQQRRRIPGLETLGSGSVLAGWCSARWRPFIIERQLNRGRDRSSAQGSPGSG
jgi:AGZA family xanthine/uracil permease-like MFS transporter